MTRKPRAVTGAEQDVVTGWRRVLCYMQRAGVTSKIKRQMRRRARREVKHRLRKGGDE